MATSIVDEVRFSAAYPADPMQPQPYVVRRVRKDTHDTVTLELAPVNGGAMPFAPGQFTMLYVFGVGEVPISISGDPARPHLLVHTIRAVGAVTAALTALKRGAMVGVRGPFGSPWPLEAAQGHDVVLVPGGIGLAPLRPALYHLLAHRQHYGRVILLYGARTPSDLLYQRDVQRWRVHRDLEVDVTVDRAAADWRGAVGVVTTLVPRALFDPTRTIAMICGPEVMMRFVALELQKRGVGPQSIYLSMERNMKCAIGLCGHCQFGPTFVCKDGPVMRFDRVKDLLGLREV
jgi:NAD(P)H-flavin reductase